MQNGLKADGTIETKGSQVFNVPATDEGKQFLSLARKFLNRSKYKTINARGRGKRVHNGQRYDDSLPQKLADWFAVYVPVDLPPWAGEELNQLRRENRNLEEKVAELQKEASDNKALALESDSMVRALQSEENGINTVVMIGDVAVRVEGATGVYVEK